METVLVRRSPLAWAPGMGLAWVLRFLAVAGFRSARRCPGPASAMGWGLATSKESRSKLAVTLASVTDSAWGSE